METILRKLEPLVEQGEVESFFDNVKNADKLGGVIGDIHDAVVVYRVCVCELFISGTSDVRIRLRCGKISTTRVVGPLLVSLTLSPFIHVE